MARVELIGPASQSVLECDHYTASRRHLAPQPLQNSRSLNHKELLLYASVAAGAFHLAWTFPILNALALIYAWALMQIAAAPSAALSFRFGFLSGFMLFAPQLAWFWNIFGVTSISLWAVLSLFTGLFTALLQYWRRPCGARFLWLATPTLWTGIEFFRSELYALKFSWLSVGYLFSEGASLLPVGTLGVYGTGFAIFLLAAIFLNRPLYLKGALVIILTLLLNWPTARTSNSSHTAAVKVAGIQLEFPPDLEVPGHLDRVLATHPDAQILVLSEYAFDGPVPKRVRDWCRRQGKYLIAGGKEDVFESGKKNFRNTAFVIDPNGEIVFQQGKSVPIQFFNDGLPARNQKIWESPWGRIAIPTCYDLSYRRVTDKFVAAGAEAFIVPFMDVEDWGERQHRQHTRIAPLRAREYGLEVFRLGSSGISQHIDRGGNLLSQATFPGQQEIIGGMLHMSKPSLPLDHWLAPICSALVGLGMLLLPFVALRERSKARRADLTT